MNQPLAYVHPGAKIAKNVVIEPFATINNDVVIGGDLDWIKRDHYGGGTYWENCTIFPGAVISAPPQDLKYNGEETQTIIGDNTTIRECVTINRGTVDRQKTVVGNHCLIMAYCHVAHDCVVGDHCIFSNNSTLAGHVNVGNYVILAGMTAIHQFCTIGDYAFITGGSLVRKDVPPYVKAAREPLSYVGVNSVGLRRRGFSTEKLERFNPFFRILYQKNYNNSQAAEILEAEMQVSPERDEILDFIKNSHRGIMKGYFRKN